MATTHRSDLVEQLEKALTDEAYDGGNGALSEEQFAKLVRTLATTAAEVVDETHVPAELLSGADHTAAKYWRRMREAETERARAMARVEELSDHLGIPYVYETGHGPVRPAVTPPVYLAADLWDALGAPVADFDAYYERNRWADTWANLLGVVRDRVKPKCGQDIEGEKCVLTAGHLPPHYGSSDVGRSEPVPVPEPQGEPSDAHPEVAAGGAENPCGALEQLVLRGGAVTVGCGLERGHYGPHRFWAEWHSEAGGEAR